jgi:uroporphyrinogen decarboxylase
LSDVVKKIREASQRVREKLSSEAMTPLERMRTTADFREPDRVPIILQIHEYAARIARMRVKDICESPEKHVLSQLLAMERYGHDLPCSFVDSYNIEAEALGCKVEYFPDKLPEITDRVLKEKSDLERLCVPDPHRDGRMPWVFEVNDLLEEHLPRLLSPYAAVTAPFSIACSLRGYENLITDIPADPDFVHRLMEFCTQVTIRYGREQLAGPALSSAIIDAWASPPLVNMSIFDEFVLPYTSRAIGALTPPGANWGGIWGASVVNDWRSLIRRVIGSGSTNVRAFGRDLDAGVPLREFKALCAQHQRPILVTLGAVDIVSGTPQTIRAKVAKRIQEGAAGGGFVLYAAIVPIETRHENLLAFVEAGKRFGRYPLDL